MSVSGTPVRLFVTGIAWIVMALLGAQLVVVIASILLTGGADSLGVAMAISAIAVLGVVAVAGIVSGVGLLLRKGWARTVLEGLTWGCCAICLAATAFGVYSFATWSDPSDRWVPAISMVGYPFVLVGLTALLWALRSRRMRDALGPAAQQALPADGGSGTLT